MINLYNKTSYNCSKIVATNYSTSFSIGIRMLKKEFRDPVYAIYGYVRIADEIVDTFHDYDKKALLEDYKKATYEALETKISSNPVINSFQEVVHKYNIDIELIEAFLNSMKMDLYNRVYDEKTYKNYLYGSAEVVGLMCLKVFCEGNEVLYQNLKGPARALGSGFQKVNFLRDMRSDFNDRGRVYFPGVDFNKFTIEEKEVIENDILKDFEIARNGIKALPKGSKFGVYVAFMYFYSLLKKIRKSSEADITKERVRVGNVSKIFILCDSFLRFKFKML